MSILAEAHKSSLKWKIFKLQRLKGSNEMKPIEGCKRKTWEQLKKLWIWNNTSDSIHYDRSLGLPIANWVHDVDGNKKVSIPRILVAFWLCISVVRHKSRVRGLVEREEREPKTKRSLYYWPGKTITYIPIAVLLVKKAQASWQPNT